MQGGIGALILAGLAGAGVLAGIFALYFYGFSRPRRRPLRGSGGADLLGDGRVEVLERTVLDGERSLVLIRCDDVEHLIMVGGPADVVVENDVHKIRGLGSQYPQLPPPDASPRASRIPHDFIEQDVAEAVAERAEPSPQPIPDVVERTSPPPETPPAENGRQRQVEPSFGMRDLGGSPPRRSAQPTPLGGDFSERPSERATERPAERRGEAAASMSGRSNGRQADEAPSMPSASIPWAEPDSIENEIVRALRIDPVQQKGRANGAAPEPPVQPKKPDSPTTLGDLADRLEEALAKEVQSANQALQENTDFDDDFNFDQPEEDARPSPASLQPRPFEQPARSFEEPTRPTEPASREPHFRQQEQHSRHREQASRQQEPHPRQRDRERDAREYERPAAQARAFDTHPRFPENRNAEQPTRAARRDFSAAAEPPAPHNEPERRRETPSMSERREEAPVISLNARRREAADPLEDEMARLLGELTGDKGG